MKRSFKFTRKNTRSQIDRILTLTILISLFSIVNLSGQEEELYWSAEDQMSEIYKLGSDQRIPIAKKKKIFRRVIKGTLKTLDSLRVGLVMTETKLQGMILEAYCHRYLKRYGKSELLYLKALDIINQKVLNEIGVPQLGKLRFSTVVELAQLYSEKDKEIPPLKKELLNRQSKWGCGFYIFSSRNIERLTYCKALINREKYEEALILIRKYGIWINKTSSYTNLSWRMDEQYSRILKNQYTSSQIRDELSRSIKEITFEDNSAITIKVFGEKIKMQPRIQMIESDLEDDNIRYKVRDMITNTNFYQELIK